MGGPAGVLGRRHGDRVGRRADHAVSREAVAPADGVDGPDCRRTGVGHRVLRVDGLDTARRARRREAHPAGRRVRVRASAPRAAAGPEGDDGGGGRLPGRGARGRSHDGRAAGQAGAVRGLGLPRGVGGGAGSGGGPAAPAAAGADDPPAGGGRVPGVGRERRVSGLDGGRDPRRPQRDGAVGTDVRGAAPGRRGARRAGRHRARRRSDARLASAPEPGGGRGPGPGDNPAGDGPRDPAGAGHRGLGPGPRRRVGDRRDVG